MGFKNLPSLGCKFVWNARMSLLSPKEITGINTKSSGGDECLLRRGKKCCENAANTSRFNAWFCLPLSLDFRWFLGRADYCRVQEYEFYYLQSRYYNPEVGRFLNADAFASTGQGLLGNNMLSYCQNNPITYADSTGMCAHTLYAPWMGDCSDCITYDVPLYEQGTLNLCWAYSQVMIEQFHSNQYPKMSQGAATVRAVSLAMRIKVLQVLGTRRDSLKIV